MSAYRRSQVLRGPIVLLAHMPYRSYPSHPTDLRTQDDDEADYEESPLVHKQTCDDCAEREANDYFRAGVAL